MSSPERPGFLRRFARGLVKIYYPRIEVTGGALLPRAGPVLLVANHPNSLIDPVLLGIAARRPVRLMAKAPLFDVPVLGALLRAVGMVPAYRGSDDARQVARNLESIAAAAGHLAQGAVLGIFPEGRSHDAPQLAQVRSGAARLAMQAVGLGAKGLRVVPVGINYERKERFRTAVWIKLGRPIDAANWLRGHGGDERRAMRTLTQEIDARLRHCVIHLDHAAWEPLLGDVEALLPPAPGGRGAALANLHRRLRAAQAINHFQRTNPERAAVAADRVRAHAAALRRVGVAADARLLAWRGPVLAAVMGRDGLLMGVATALALPGLLHHLLPYGAVRLLAGRLAGPGRMVVALSRLLLSLPIYAAWYAFVWWRMNLYFVPWVAWTWVLAMPLAGIGSLAAIRWLRTAGRLWWAEARLLGNRGRAAALRSEHAAVGRLLEEFATEVKLPTHPGPAKSASVVLRPPWW
jgi:1-acyl-sn-glycerol-3-phosphate acyltransferase